MLLLKLDHGKHLSVTFILYNIPIKNVSKINIIGDFNNVEYECSDEHIISSSQRKYNLNNSIYEYSYNGSTICCAIEGNTVSPEKIICTFPSQGDINGVTNFVSRINSIFNDFKASAMLIAFQDRSDVYGSFLKKDVNGNSIYINDFIKNLLKRYGLVNSDLFFYGNSKGGYIGNDISVHFPNSESFFVVPPIENNTISCNARFCNICNRAV